MNQEPLISVIIPTHNRASLLPRAIKSVLNQTYRNFEIIVVDDGSTDGTIDKLKMQFPGNPHIKLFQVNPNKGAQHARNLGIKKASGEWITFLDSDDEYLPEKLSVCINKAIESNSPIIHCECLVKKGNNDTVLFNVPSYQGKALRDLLKLPGPVFPGLMAKKECFTSIGYLDENIVSYQEWDTSIRLAEQFCFAFEPTPLFIYHCHEGETISKDMLREVQGWLQIVTKHKGLIIKQCGRDALANHYKIIAQKFAQLGLEEKRLSYQIKHYLASNKRARLKIQFTKIISILPDSVLLIAKYFYSKCSRVINND